MGHDPRDEAKIKCLTFLLRHGGDPNIKNNRGLTVALCSKT